MRAVAVGICMGVILTAGFPLFAERWDEELRVGKQADQFEASCAAELETYCKDVPPGKGRLIACINSHKENISPECKSAVSEASKTVQDIPEDLNWFAAACLDDIEKLCKASAIDPASISKCLDDNKDQLSTKCNELREQRAQRAAGR